MKLSTPKTTPFGHFISGHTSCFNECFAYFAWFNFGHTLRSPHRRPFWPTYRRSLWPHEGRFRSHSALPALRLLLERSRAGFFGVAAQFGSTLWVYFTAARQCDAAQGEAHRESERVGQRGAILVLQSARRARHGLRGVDLKNMGTLKKNKIFGHAMGIATVCAWPSYARIVALTDKLTNTFNKQSGRGRRLPESVHA